MNKAAANGCNITKSEKFKGVRILSVPTVYTYTYIYIHVSLEHRASHKQHLFVVYL